MQVLLIEDVDNLGYAGDVKKVANGFGRNYLIPQQLAVLATSGALKQAETIRNAAEKRRAQETDDANAIANQISGLKIVFERRAGETGKLYGSVTSGDIAEAIEAKSEIVIDKRKVSLAEPVRNLGVQEVTIKLMIDVSTTINVEVLPLGGILERERLSQAEVDQIEAEATGEVIAEATPIEEVVAEETPAVEAAVEEAVAEVTADEESAEEDAVEASTEEDATEEEVVAVSTEDEEKATEEEPAE